MLLKFCEKYVVYLLSNINEIYWKWVCEYVFLYWGFCVEDYFEKMYFLYEMKMVKFVEEIFWGVFDDVNFDLCEIFFIDDFEVNCQGVQVLGIFIYIVKFGEDWRLFFVEN